MKQKFLLIVYNLEKKICNKEKHQQKINKALTKNLSTNQHD